ncbi:retrovirus-related pol polyprotein from transposon TNT 1-94 [Trifolium medium]|uniref:Retrovirus-related pol polyprotein from transposon TNT 1-94 n=1 Tax=Trifolium medium TaxID=97028 RepID=A0A392NAD6_9FABA|nr:retrovirus-related pol polyprotein from transposon TNT 1-94 [Trifolium medium]
MMIYSRFDSPTVEDVESLLLLQEAQFEKFKQELNNPSVSANVAHTDVHSNESVNDQDLPEAASEHYNVNPQRGRGKGKGRGRGRGRNQHQGQGKVQCQICGKSNHDAVGCWYRYDPNAMRNNTRGYNAGQAPRPPNFNPYMRPTANLAMPQFYAPMTDMDTLSSASWYPDSGASHHLTFNPNNLAYRTPYNGHEQVMMGNGQGVSIKSLGQSQFSSPHNPNVHFKLNELLHVPNISKNLLSESKQVLLEGVVGTDGLYQFKPFKFLTNSGDSYSSTSSNWDMPTLMPFSQF